MYLYVVTKLVSKKIGVWEKHCSRTGTEPKALRLAFPYKIYFSLQWKMWRYGAAPVLCRTPRSRHWLQTCCGPQRCPPWRRSALPRSCQLQGPPRSGRPRWSCSEDRRTVKYRQMQLIRSKKKNPESLNIAFISATNIFMTYKVKYSMHLFVLNCHDEDLELMKTQISCGKSR